MIVTLAAGTVGRNLAREDSSVGFLADLLPWLNGTSVTLYFGDATDDHLVPVSRSLTGDKESLEGLATALFDGPETSSGLVSLIPTGTIARSVSFEAGVLTVDLSGEYSQRTAPLADEALIQSLASWPEVEEVRVTVEGTPLDTRPSSGHLLFFYDESRDMLVAEPSHAEDLRGVLAAYLAGSPDHRLTGLPADVEVLRFRSAVGSGLLELNMSYSPSVERFALEDGDAMRRVLEGLIATLTTGFPSIQYVYLDFEGRATLGLGQCANLLRRVQPPPAILNDERLLSNGRA